MKYIFVLNKFGKKGIYEIYRRIQFAAEDLGLDYDIEINDTNYSTADILEKYKDDRKIIVAVGGDGMINTVLNNIVDTDNILSYIPYGTGNDLDRTVKLELDEGINKVDLVRINDKYFINIACFGIDADIANDDRFIHNKKIPESMRYNAGVIYHFAKYKGRHMIVDIDNETIDKKFSTVVVANAKYYGGGYKIAPNSHIADGKLNVYLADNLNRLALAKLVLSTKDGSHIQSKHVRMIKTDKVTIKCDEEIESNIDGEILKGDTFNIELLPKKIELCNDQRLIDKVLKEKIKVKNIL